MMEHVRAKAARKKTKSHLAARDKNSFDCAVATVAAEAGNQTITEQAVVANGLVKSALDNRRSICAEARSRYHLGGEITTTIIAAVTNVFWQGGTMVPPQFSEATEFRAPNQPMLPRDKYLYVGQITRDGNKFYVPLMR